MFFQLLSWAAEMVQFGQPVSGAQYLLLVISFSFHHPVKHRHSPPGPLFPGLPSRQLAETACLRREHSWWISLSGLPADNGSTSILTHPLFTLLPLGIYPVFLIYYYFFKLYFIFKLYIIVLVLSNINMNPPQVYLFILDKSFAFQFSLLMNYLLCARNCSASFS